MGWILLFGPKVALQLMNTLIVAKLGLKVEQAVTMLLNFKTTP
jgi:hypothetical protein